MTEPTIDPVKLFAPIERAILEAFALRSGAKALASLRPLMWLAYLALAQAFGLAHLITPEMRAFAIDAARRPGRRKVEQDGQSSLLDLFPMNDGRPGIYVSFARLKLGNVRDVRGDSVLDLIGITELPDALVKAYEQGWIGGPSGNGLRFLPPTIWGLVVDHNAAGFARNGAVDEYIASLESLNDQWQKATGAPVPDAAKRKIEEWLAGVESLEKKVDLLETSIAESARLPIAAKHVEPIAAPCPHKEQSVTNGIRTCDACGEVLPPIEKGRTKSMVSSRVKESPKTKPAKRATKKAAKGRAS